VNPPRNNSALASATKKRSTTILTVESAGHNVAALAGGKGLNLFRLSQAGAPVPRWAIVGADVLASFRETSGLGDEIEQALSDLSPDTLDATADRIKSMFLGVELDLRTLEVIASAREYVGSKALAVRSSGLDEDGTTLSFAGQYATFLNVASIAAVADRLKACWASAYSAHSLRYRMLHDLQLEAVDMGIILQEVVPAEKSGVMFTVSPGSDESEIMISAAYGLGEGIVTGLVDADTVVVDRQTGRVKDTVVGDKQERVDAIADGNGCETREVDPAEQNILSLSPDEISWLYAHAQHIESIFGKPQDIEWAIDDAKVWILQSRPITTGRASKKANGELRIWDNSNIIESYGEITGPLTFSFARHLYYRVHKEYCELLGVPSRHMSKMDEWLPNMLGYFNGRVYYNLLNWYKVIRLLPFYSVNRKVLELSLGVQEPLGEDLAMQQRPFKAESRIEALMLRTLIALRFTWYSFRIKRVVDSFLVDYYRLYGKFEPIDYSELSAHETYKLFREVEGTLLARWGRMIVLDATIGLTYGTLQVLTQRWLPNAPEWLRWDVVRVTAEVESAGPAQRLEAIARLVHGDKVLRQRIQELPPEQANEVLRSGSVDPGTAELLKEIDRYLDEFGYRSANELKLEEPDLREDPSPFFSMLKSAVARVDVRQEPSYKEGERITADEYLHRELHGGRRWCYGIVRRRVQRLLAARERVRFCRTRVFGMARRMFRAIGEDLTRVGVIGSTQDVFYLRLEELRWYFEGTMSHKELRPLIEMRKAQEIQNGTLEAPPRFTTEGNVYGGDLDRAWSGAGAAAPTDIRGSGDELLGTPCSPGTVVGEAQVVDRPRDVGGQVLVTYRTDPGWIAALSSASALLIERGSPLTHVAVVARELEIPTVVQIPGLTRHVRTGMRLHVDGETGRIAIMNSEKAGS
jgi:rifampicin phosphotransferase